MDLTKHQEKQMAYLNKLESRERLTSVGNLIVKCNDCKDEIYCHCADTAKMFLYEHIGHYTWITNMGNTKS